MSYSLWPLLVSSSKLKVLPASRPGHELCQLPVGQSFLTITLFRGMSSPVPPFQSAHQRVELLANRPSWERVKEHVWLDPCVNARDSHTAPSIMGRTEHTTGPSLMDCQDHTAQLAGLLLAETDTLAQDPLLFAQSSFPVLTLHIFQAALFGWAPG